VSILDYFPKHLAPRQEQRDALLKLEEMWDEFDVFVLNLPVSVGKSAIAITISNWLKGRSVILTPSNILVEQYLKDYPQLHTIKRKDQYSCHSLMDQASCADFSATKKFTCKNCPYKLAVAKKDFVKTSVANYYTYLAYKMFRETLIIDEAHQLRGMVTDQMSTKLWKFKYKYPYSLRSYDDLKKWVDRHPSLLKDKTLQLLKQELNQPTPRYLVEKGTDYYRGRQEEALLVKPIDTSAYSGLLWPTSKVRKLVLMSATISNVDIHQLGLAKRRVITINSGSPIPPAQRPVFFDEETALQLSIHSKEEDYQKLAAEIRRIIELHPNQKGFVHITYSLLNKVRPLLEGKSDRYIFHTKEDKLLKYQAYRQNQKDAVLFACGLYEGVDLLEDMGRFQLITKVPWPSLAEPAIRWQAEANPSYYAWEATKVVIQATGRICRSPTDYGTTHILDRSFARLYVKNKEQFPQWFRDGLVMNERKV